MPTPRVLGKAGPLISRGPHLVIPKRAKEADCADIAPRRIR